MIGSQRESFHSNNGEDCSSKNVFQFSDHGNKKQEQDKIFDYASMRGTNTPIVIDNGSYQCKAGWSGQKSPHLIFRPVVGKVRGKSDVFVGNDLDPVEYVKLNARSPFDKEAIIQYDTQEQIFDYIFSKLGIDSHGSVNHPLLLTECICNPKYCRRSMTELLFETYGIPSLCYGIDAMFSYYHHIKSNPNVDGTNNALIVRSGFHASHIIPFVNNSCDLSHCKRISLGGYDATDLTLKLMQLKYPQHRHVNNVTNAQEVKEHHMYTSLDYLDEIRRLSKDPKYFEQQTHIFQLPYKPTVIETVEKTPEEIEEIKRKRKEQSENMRKMLKVRNEERKIEEERQLQDLESLKKIKILDPKTYIERLKMFGYDDEQEMEETYESLLKRIKKRRATEGSLVVGQNQVSGKALPAPSTSLKPTGTMNPSGKEEQDLEVQYQKMESELRLTRQRRNQLLQRVQKQLRKKMIRDKQKQQKKLQQRSAGSSKSRKKSEASKKKLKAMVAAIEDQEDEAAFGMNEEDWDVYMVLNEEEEEEDADERDTLPDNERELSKLDEKIQDLEKKLYGKSSHTITKLYYNKSNVSDYEVHDHYMLQYLQIMDQEKKNQLKEEEWFQMKFTVERIRIPEMLFQPSIVGLDQAGLSECIETTLKCYTPDIQLQLAKNIYVCGGNAMYPQFDKRIHLEIQKILPFGSEIRVYRQNDPLDAWRGASMFASSIFQQNSKSMSLFPFISQKEYQEYGADYFKEFAYSNKKI